MSDDIDTVLSHDWMDEPQPGATPRPSVTEATEASGFNGFSYRVEDEARAGEVLDEHLKWIGLGIPPLSAARYKAIIAAMLAFRRETSAGAGERAVSRTEIIREWVGGERYARDYEYCDATFGPNADRILALFSTPSAPEQFAENAKSPPAQTAGREATVQDHNDAFDPADEAGGNVFRAGFQEGWIFAQSPDGTDYDDLKEQFGRAVDMEPSEAWHGYRETFFAALPLAAIPPVGSALATPSAPADASADVLALRAASEVHSLLAKAYADGANEVHSYWKQCRPDIVFDREPDFTEAASDYARHETEALALIDDRGEG